MSELEKSNKLENKTILKNDYILEVKNLTIEIRVEKGTFNVINDISITIKNGEPFGIVGESGCGKTITMLSILGLLPSQQTRITSGRIIFNGNDLLNISKKRLRRIRGKEISMIFQEPMTALNPVFSVGTQIMDIIKWHKQLSAKEAYKRVIDLINIAGIPDPEKIFHRYPHQLSGGLKQRICIAMALSCNPKLLIADEPTTALDVTTQDQVLEQITSLRRKFKMALILVTHDLALIAENCKNCIIMYCGNIVESATVQDLFKSPKHPYTIGLFESVPKIRKNKLSVMPTIMGTVPDFFNTGEGCVFAMRCPKVKEKCYIKIPSLKNRNGRVVACFYPD